MSGIGEVGEKSVEVGVEVWKFAERREGFADALPPPSPLEATKLVMPKPESEGQPGRRTESAAKTGGDGLLRGVEAELPREAGVGASDGLARLEQGARRRRRMRRGSRNANPHGLSFFTFHRFPSAKTGAGAGSSPGGLRRAHQKTSHSAPHAAR